jgi:hypothetical protein
MAGTILQPIKTAKILSEAQYVAYEAGLPTFFACFVYAVEI